MTIDNLEMFTASLPDWSVLSGCFGSGRIRPMDIDGVVERGGVLLVLEHKGGNAPLKTAQRLTFEALVRQGNTVIVYWTPIGLLTEVNRIMVGERLVRQDRQIHRWRYLKNPCLETFRSFAQEWYANADATFNEHRVRTLNAAVTERRAS